MTYCPVCAGSRFIDVSLRPELAMSPTRLDAIPKMQTIQASSKRFDCPECSVRTADHDRVLTVGASVRYNAYTMKEHGEEYKRSVEGHVVSLLAHKILDCGHVQFETRKASDAVFGDEREMIGTIGVVSPEFVASIEQRAIAARNAMLPAIAEAVEREVRSWGGRSMISKDDAGRMIRNAIQKEASK